MCLVCVTSRMEQVLLSEWRSMQQWNAASSSLWHDLLFEETKWPNLERIIVNIIGYLEYMWLVYLDSADPPWGFQPNEHIPFGPWRHSQYLGMLEHSTLTLYQTTSHHMQYAWPNQDLRRFWHCPSSKIVSAIDARNPERGVKWFISFCGKQQWGPNHLM